MKKNGIFLKLMLLGGFVFSLNVFAEQTQPQEASVSTQPGLTERVSAKAQEVQAKVGQFVDTAQAKIGQAKQTLGQVGEDKLTAAKATASQYVDTAKQELTEARATATEFIGTVKGRVEEAKAAYTEIKGAYEGARDTLAPMISGLKKLLGKKAPPYPVNNRDIRYGSEVVIASGELWKELIGSYATGQSGIRTKKRTGRPKKFTPAYAFLSVDETRPADQQVLQAAIHDTDVADIEKFPDVIKWILVDPKNPSSTNIIQQGPVILKNKKTGTCLTIDPMTNKLILFPEDVSKPNLYWQFNSIAKLDPIDFSFQQLQQKVPPYNIKEKDYVVISNFPSQASPDRDFLGFDSKSPFFPKRLGEFPKMLNNPKSKKAKCSLWIIKTPAIVQQVPAQQTVVAEEVQETAPPLPARPAPPIPAELTVQQKAVSQPKTQPQSFMDK